MNWQSIAYFLGWAALFALMMRFGCGAHVMGHRRRSTPDASEDRDLSHGNSGQSAVLVRDPVCGMTVTAATAKSAVYQDKTYYFCSSACREKFEAAPTQYSSTAATASPSKEHRHGCC